MRTASPKPGAPTKAWIAYGKRLQDEVTNTSIKLKEAEDDVKKLQEELESLSFAMELTRQEFERRSSGEPAKTDNHPVNEVSSETRPDEIGKLEAELLAKKDESANVAYEIEQLESELCHLYNHSKKASAKQDRTDLDDLLKPAPSVSSASSANSPMVSEMCSSPLSRGAVAETPKRRAVYETSAIVQGDDGSWTLSRVSVMYDGKVVSSPYGEVNEGAVVKSPVIIESAKDAPSSESQAEVHSLLHRYLGKMKVTIGEEKNSSRTCASVLGLTEDLLNLSDTMKKMENASPLSRKKMPVTEKEAKDAKRTHLNET